jgi:hypothetical protein
MLDKLLQTTDARGHHRLACQHRLQAGDGSGFLPRGQHEDDHDPEQSGRIALVAREHGSGLEAQIGCLLAQVAGLWAVSDQQLCEGG